MSDIAVAAYAVGDIPDLKQAISKWVEAKDTFTPNPENTKYYQNAFSLHQKILKESMSDTFSNLVKLRNLKGGNL